MNAKTNGAHTPGPWRIDPYGLGVVVGPDGFSIQTSGPDCIVGDESSYANARLIAAAPELLAIALSVAAHFEGTDSPLGLAAAAAIQKAEGR